MTDKSLLSVSGLKISLPNGEVLISNFSVDLKPGEIVVLFGSSGAGKSTLTGVLHDRPGFESKGFRVEYEKLESNTPIGVVPQRGALFDHLSIADNIAIAIRNAIQPRTPAEGEISEWLRKVDLPKEWSREKRQVSQVSGGEAQRLSVARTLACGRKILIMDEPSVGLDPYRISLLSKMLKEDMESNEAAALVVTHDLLFAANVGDRFLVINKKKRKIEELGAPNETEGDTSGVWTAMGLERRLSKGFADEGMADEVSRKFSKNKVLNWLLGIFLPFEVFTRAIITLPHALLFRFQDVMDVMKTVIRQTLLRPLLFFVISSVLLGYTILYVFGGAFSAGEIPIRLEKIFSLIGSMHIITLAPAISAILFIATAGNAVTAWMGGMSLTGQVIALRGIGVKESRYLWAPCLLSLAFSYLVVALVFVLGMILGGMAYFALQGISGGFEIVTADLLDPPPSRQPYLLRALLLVVLYAFGLASDAVAKGSTEKNSSESVTVSMVKSVMVATLWIVAAELTSLAILRGSVGA